MNGSDFEDNIRTLKGENERLLEANKEDTNEKD
jgi:hypothetical protein